MTKDDRNFLVDAISTACNKIVAVAEYNVNYYKEPLEEGFPITAYKKVEIDGVVYMLKLEATLRPMAKDF